MARSHARIKVTIWRNAGWVELSPEAKLLYLTVLSQPRLSLVGVIDFAPSRWRHLTALDHDAFDDALAELEDERYFIIDRSSEELLIRTFVAHDLDPGRVNKNLGRGFWGAWEGVASAALRSVVCHEMPDELWEKLAPFGPVDAAETRRSARLEPEREIRSQPQDDFRSQPPLSSPLSPVSCRQPEPATTSERPEVQRRRVLEAAAAIIGNRAASRPGVQDETAVAKGVTASVIRDRYEDAYKHLAAYPTTTPDELAEHLEPTGPPSKLEPANTSALIPPVEQVLAARPEPNRELGIQRIRAIRNSQLEAAQGGAA